MAGYTDNEAFDAMNDQDPDQDISGGAIMQSEFETNMPPREQDQYRRLVMDSLNSMYENDPMSKKRNLSFSDWLDKLAPGLIEERALKWDKVRNNPELKESLDPKEHRNLEEAGFLDSLLQRHTGSILDVRDIIGLKTPKDYNLKDIKDLKFRR